MDCETTGLDIDLMNDIIGEGLSSCFCFCSDSIKHCLMDDFISSDVQIFQSY